MYTYGIYGLEKTVIYKKYLSTKLKIFYQYNKSFGRMQYKRGFFDLNQTTNNNAYKHISYNTKHISFHKIRIKMPSSFGIIANYLPISIVDEPQQNPSMYENDTDNDNNHFNTNTNVNYESDISSVELYDEYDEILDDP
jgi:hypothetical protein